MQPRSGRVRHFQADDAATPGQLESCESYRWSRLPGLMSRRLLAIGALLAAAATIALAVTVAIGEFPRGLLLLGCVLITGAAAWYGVLRRGLARVVGLIVAGLGLAGALVLLVTQGVPLVDLLVVVGLLVSLAAARAAFAVHVDLPSAPAPQNPVLFYNPKSGGG